MKQKECMATYTKKQKNEIISENKSPKIKKNVMKKRYNELMELKQKVGD